MIEKSEAALCVRRCPLTQSMTLWWSHTYERCHFHTGSQFTAPIALHYDCIVRLWAITTGLDNVVLLSYTVSLRIVFICGSLFIWLCNLCLSYLCFCFFLSLFKYLATIHGEIKMCVLLICLPVGEWSISIKVWSQVCK